MLGGHPQAHGLPALYQFKQSVRIIVRYNCIVSHSRNVRLSSNALPGPQSNSPSKEGHGARSASPKPAIEAWEIVQALPQLPDGITITNFLKLFEGRVGDKADSGRMAKSDWIKLVKENCHYGSDKLLRRKS